MAKSIFYNKEKAEEEQKEKKAKISEQERRAIYFQRLGNDKNFRKYVIEDILDVEIQANKDISSGLAGFISASPEEVKSIIVGKSAALKCSENIKNKIVSNF